MPAHFVESGILVDVAIRAVFTLGGRNTTIGGDLYVAFT